MVWSRTLFFIETIILSAWNASKLSSRLSLFLNISIINYFCFLNVSKNLIKREFYTLVVFLSDEYTLLWILLTNLIGGCMISDYLIKMRQTKLTELIQMQLFKILFLKALNIRIAYGSIIWINWYIFVLIAQRWNDMLVPIFTRVRNVNENLSNRRVESSAHAFEKFGRFH